MSAAVAAFSMLSALTWLNGLSSLTIATLSLALEPAHEGEGDVAVGRDRLEGIVIAANSGSVDEVVSC